jgi:hypothetical protein
MTPELNAARPYGRYPAQTLGVTAARAKVFVAQLIVFFRAWVAGGGNP